MKLGFHPGMSYDDYAASPALNYSTLKHLRRSPMAFQHHRDHKSKPTNAMRLGSAAHVAVLEPERLGELAVWTGGRRYSKAWDAFRAEHAGRLIVSTEEFAAANDMCAAVRSYEPAQRYLLGDGTSEISMFWRDAASGRDLKGRIDRLTFIDGEPWIVDLKSTRDCTAMRFGNDAFRFGYYIQFAMYADGHYYVTGKLPRVAVIAVENKRPFESAVYVVPDDVLQQGHDDFARLIQRLGECESTGIYPGAQECEGELSLPTYAYGDSGDDLSDLELVAGGDFE